MSRSVMTFQKFLWSWGNMRGGIPLSHRRFATVMASWRKGEDVYRVGDRMTLQIEHKRGGVMDHRAEVWECVKVQRERIFGEGHPWEGADYKVKFERVHQERSR